MQTERNLLDHHVQDWEDFRSGASKLLADHQSKLRDYDLSLIEFVGYDGLVEKASEFSVSEFRTAALEKLRALALSEDAIGILGQDRVCVIHDRTEQTDEVLQSINDLSAEIDPDGSGVAAKRMVVAMSHENVKRDDAMAALTHLVDQFANGGKVPNAESLTQAHVATKEFEKVQLRAFRCTVQSGGFSVALQPVVKLADRELDHYEALARFEHLTGDSSPAHYLRLAERSSLIAEFDYAMINQVVELLSESANLENQPPIAVNLSAVSLSNERFVRSLLRRLNSQTLPPGYLAVEITDSGKLKDLSSVNVAVQSLRQAGIPIGLDDFGSDSADLNMLSKVQVDYVKIDGQYIARLLEMPKAKSFLRAISILCEELEVETVAKAVENEATAEFLCKYGISHAQGRLFGSPRYASSVLFEPQHTAVPEADDAPELPQDASDIPARDEEERKTDAPRDEERILEPA